MSITERMDEELYALCLMASRERDPAKQAALVKAQQGFEQIRMAVLALEGLAYRPARPSPAVMVSPGWAAQRAAQASDLAGSVVDLSRFRAARAGGAA